MSHRARKGNIPRTPISYSLLSISDSFWARNGSWAGKSDNLCTSDLIDPHSLLYLPSALGQHRGTRHTCDNPLYPEYGTFSSPWPLYVTHLVSTEDLISLHHYRRYFEHGTWLTLRKSTFLSSFCSWCFSCLIVWDVCVVYVYSMYRVWPVLEVEGMEWMNAKLYHRQSPYHYITFSILHPHYIPYILLLLPPCTSYLAINSIALSITTVHKQIRINRYPNHPNQASQPIIVQLGSVTGRLVTFDNSRVLSRAFSSDT